MKVLLISKDTKWSRSLFSSLSNNDFECMYSSVCSKTLLDNIKPDWVFFFHWSEIIIEPIFKNYKCVVVHTGKLPECRGGSPIQNQIMDGITTTHVNLLTMEEKVDSGKIYCKEAISLQGSLSDIWQTITRVTCNLIKKCVIENPKPVNQTSKECMVYKRRKKQPIKFDNVKNISYIYEQIRMMDDDEYPTSYITMGDYTLEFSRAKLKGNGLLSDVFIYKTKKS
jgi:methionyl-tRNA formyltransferase